MRAGARRLAATTSTPIDPVGVGVIGYGYWGPNVVRNLAECPETRLMGVADSRPDRLLRVAARHPLTGLYRDAADLIADPAIEAVVVATPVQTHFPLAIAALRAGKHVLVEKPIASTSDETRCLIDEAGRRGLTLMVDHTFVYTGAVQKIRELIEEDALGSLYYYDSVRVNLGLFQSDVSVLWDLAVHDLSIMDFVLGLYPDAVSATGVAHIPGSPVNTAYLTCHFGGRLLAHLHVNWLAPVKVRRTLIGGNARMVVYDDLEPSEKVKVYDRGIQLDESPDAEYQRRVGYRSGDMWAPRVDLEEALAVEMAHFARCIRSGATPLSDGLSGLRLVKILEAADRSLELQGRPIDLREACG